MKYIQLLLIPVLLFSLGAGCSTNTPVEEDRELVNEIEEQLLITLPSERTNLEVNEIGIVYTVSGETTLTMQEASDYFAEQFSLIQDAQVQQAPSYQEGDKHAIGVYIRASSSGTPQTLSFDVSQERGKTTFTLIRNGVTN